MRVRTTALMTLLSVVPGLSAAAAQEVPTAPTPYHVDWAVDLSIIGAATALWVVTPLLGREVIRPVCPCSSSDLNGLDRYPVGRRSNLANQLSNVAQAGILAVPVVVDALDVNPSWRDYAADLVVLAEVVTVNGALNQMVKFAVRRPRPTVYDIEPGNPERDDPRNYLAFYSGHTSTAFAAGLAYATTFALRHPDSPARGLVYGAAAVAGTGVGLLRVLAGQHFPTDVIAAGAVGGALGLVIPRLHRRTGGLLVAPGPGGATLVLTGRL
jgi:membrane-associated phospholipid phosphatase